jgi:hypothetical protein
MSKLVLTRFLYLFDEVCISFMTSVLKKESLDECYFWISELYLSGLHDQSWQFIWFIYYDFYYVKNPSLEDYISKKQVNGDLKSLMSVVKNFFKLQSSSEVFITRQYNMNIKEITHIFRGKKPNWLTKHPSKYHAILRFIDKKLYHLAISSLPETITDELFQTIKTYFNIPDERFTPFTDKFNINSNSNMDNPSKNGYDNKFHKLWALISLFIFNPDYYLSKKKIYMGSNDSEYNEIMKHNEPVPPSSNNNNQISKTLEYKRAYAIHPMCSSFKLLRDSFENINNEFWYHWEYHAYLTPIWYERFNKYDIIVDSEKKRIQFIDDDELEDFYSQYGYYPDEQSTETQNKALSLMVDINWKDWYENTFQDKDKSLYNYKDEFKFSY